MTNAEIKRAVGRKRLAELVGVGVAMVDKRTAEGCYPATWYFVICDELGLTELPRKLFSFK